jgi:hypothetical protein
VQYGLREFFRHRDVVEAASLTGGLGGKRIVIQGLGNVGYHAAKFLSEEGDTRIIAIIERDGILRGRRREDRPFLPRPGDLLVCIRTCYKSASSGAAPGASGSWSPRTESGHVGDQRSPGTRTNPSRRGTLA